MNGRAASQVFALFAVCMFAGVGLARVDAAVAASAAAARFSSHICPYSIDYPTGWQVKRGGQYDDFYNPQAHIQVSCEHLSGSGTTLAHFTQLLAAQIRRHGAKTTSVKTDKSAGHVDGYYPKPVFKRAVYFQIVVTRAHSYFFQFQLLAFTPASLKGYGSTFRHVLTTVRYS